MWSGARSDHPGSAPQTSGRAGCSAAAPATAARNGSRKTPAATRPAAIARALFAELDVDPGNRSRVS